MIRASAAKLQGRSHIETSTPCQDAYAISRTRHAVCIALADGAGSKQYSEIGAQVATNIVSAFVVRHFDKIYRHISVDSSKSIDLVLLPVLRALRVKAKRKGVSISDLASTLLFFAYKSGRYVAGHIGDGVIGMKVGAELSVLSAPENGEYANATFFVTDKSARAHFRLYVGMTKEDFGAVLMSDGTAESLYSKASQTLGPAVQRIFSWSNELSSEKMNTVLHENLEKVFSMRTSDDCSLAVLSWTAD